MNSTHIISQDVFDKIRSRFSNLEMGDEQGAVTTDPKSARFFDFDFVAEGNNLGRVSISINEIGSLKVFYSQGILENADGAIHELWYDFLREMRMFAKRRLLRFDTRDITKSNLDKDDFQHLASTTGNKDNDMNESIRFEGTKKTSRRVLEKTTLVVRHRKSIENEDHGARSRKNNIKALFIENSEGERFKYPFIHVAGAKAMQRHVANGGRPYDDMGNSIIRMSEQISQLTEFKRKVSHDQMNQSVNEITSRADQKLQSLRRQVEGLCNQGYYEKYKESFVPNAGANDLVMDQATMEDYKSKFTISSFKEELAEYFPLIHSIMQEASEVDLEEYVEEGKTEVDDSASDDTKHEAFDQFIEWANRVEEGRLEPDTIMDLKDLLDGGLTLGVDGVSAIEALQNIGVHSEELEAELKRLGDRDNGGDPESDPKDAILSWLATDDPEAAKELGYQGGGQESPDEDSEQPQMNAQPAGSPREIAELVYSMYNKNHKEEGLGPFPKGAAGVVTAVKKQLGDEAGVLAEKLVDYLSGNHKEQEGLAGAALGGVAGAVATKTPAGAMTGADIGSQIQDKLSDEGSEEDKIPAYIRKQQQQTNQTGQAATDKRNQQAGAKVWSNPRVKEEFDVILKLAGLAK